LSRKEIVRGCVSVFAGVSLWELLTTGLLLENQLFIPPPRSVLRIFWIPLLNGQFTKHFVATLLEFASGFSAACSIAVMRDRWPSLGFGAGIRVH
jgi:ABC-type nitrate/sulfonate/bicarbonate transport system permease component